jgi:ABC-2 type transport system permease protein
MTTVIRDSFIIGFKEVKQLSRDPISLALTIMFPILLIGIFIVISTAFSAPSYNIPLVIADLDDSEASADLFNHLSSSSSLIVNQVFQTEEQALASVESGEATGAVIIPHGFGNALSQGRSTFIVLQTDNSKVTSSSLIREAVAQSLEDLIATFWFEVDGSAQPIEIIYRPISGRPPSGDLILPGQLGMIVILGAFDDAVNAITRERERGTFPRLILTPVNIFSVYIGKIFATILINFMRTSLMLGIFVANGLVIRGSIPLVYLITSLIAVFTLSLGLAISSRIRSSKTLTVLEIAITFPLFQLTGAFQSPLLFAPGGRMIALMLPWTWGNEALRRIMYLGEGLAAITPNIAILFLSSLILLPLATFLSKRTI